MKSLEEFYFAGIREPSLIKLLESYGWQNVFERNPTTKAFLTQDKESDRYILQYLLNNYLHTIDFNFRSGSILNRLKTTGRQSPLMKALGVKGKGFKVLDASLGQGVDALSLLRVGCEVWGCERIAPTFVMLSAAFADFFKNSGFDWSKQFHLISGSTVEFIGTEQGQQHWDAIYFDPMYEEAAKTSKSKVKMEVFHELSGSDSDAVSTAELLLSSTERLVIKRPPKAPSLLALKPTHVFESKSVRYDMYIALKRDKLKL